MWAKSQDNVHKPQVSKRKESEADRPTARPHRFTYVQATELLARRPAKENPTDTWLTQEYQQK